MRYLIGIDVGTTGTKALLFSQDGQVLGHAYRGYPLHTPQVGYSEQEAEDWWQAVCETVREICTEEQISANVAAISLSSQGGTVVPVDTEGAPLGRAIVWNDRRCGDQRAAFETQMGGDAAMYRTTGWHLGAGLPLLTVRWLRENRPELFEKAARFLTVPDYISYKMTGKAVVDLSNAGINQFYDLTVGAYNSSLLAFAGIREEQLPVCAPSGTLVGNLTKQAADALGLTENTVFVTGAHDQYAVALGAGAIGDGDILIGSGTCWVVTAIADQPDFSAGLSQSVAAVPGMWGSLQSLSSGGVCLEWLRKQVGFEEEMPFDTINREAERRRAAEEGLFFFPFAGKAGEDKRFTKASFLGMDLSHDRFHLARAVMEGVVFQNLWMREAFRVKPSEQGIILAGGASKSPVWAQLVADISGMPVRIPEVADLACVGAAAMAGLGCGIYKTPREACDCLKMKERRLLPDMSRHQIYKKLYETYKKQAAMLADIYEV